MVQQAAYKAVEAGRPPAPTLDTLVGDFVSSRQLPTLPCFLVDISRQRNKNFYGREEVMRKLEDKLLSGTDVAVLYGLGGLGKSEVSCCICIVPDVIELTVPLDSPGVRTSSQRRL